MKRLSFIFAFMILFAIGCEQSGDVVNEIAVEQRSLDPCEIYGGATEPDADDFRWAAGTPANGSTFYGYEVINYDFDYLDSQGDAICVGEGWYAQIRIINQPCVNSTTHPNAAYIRVNGVNYYYDSSGVATVNVPLTWLNLTGETPIRFAITMPYINRSACKCYHLVPWLIGPDYENPLSQHHAEVMELKGFGVRGTFLAPSCTYAPD